MVELKIVRQWIQTRVLKNRGDGFCSHYPSSPPGCF
jgi:hypothetical protein